MRSCQRGKNKKRGKQREREKEKERVREIESERDFKINFSNQTFLKGIVNGRKSFTKKTLQEGNNTSNKLHTKLCGLLEQKISRSFKK